MECTGEHRSAEKKERVLVHIHPRHHGAGNPSPPPSPRVHKDEGGVQDRVGSNSGGMDGAAAEEVRGSESQDAVADGGVLGRRRRIQVHQRGVAVQEEADGGGAEPSGQGAPHQRLPPHRGVGHEGLPLHHGRPAKD